MKIFIYQLLICILLLATRGIALAAPTNTTETTRNDLPSCRVDLFKLKPSSPERILVIAVDETTALQGELAADTLARVQRAIKPGDRVQIIGFSGVSQDHYSFLKFDGTLDSPLTEAETNQQIPGYLVSKAQSCLRKQKDMALDKISGILVQLFAKPIDQTPAKSEILNALVNIGQQSFKPSKAGGKTLIVISDGMENSALLSFYANKHGQGVVNPEQALSLAKREGLIAALPAVDVYFVGAALAQSKPSPDLKLRLKLKSFWAEYVKQANGHLAGWGEPALLGDIL